MKAAVRMAIDKAQGPPDPRLVFRSGRNGTIPMWPARLRVIRGLLELRKRGVLQAVYVDRDRLMIRWAKDDAAIFPPVRIGWIEAARLIETSACTSPEESR